MSGTAVRSTENFRIFGASGHPSTTANVFIIRSFFQNTSWEKTGKIQKIKEVEWYADGLFCNSNFPGLLSRGVLTERPDDKNILVGMRLGIPWITKTAEQVYLGKILPCIEVETIRLVLSLCIKCNKNSNFVALVNITQLFTLLWLIF